jgi:glycosyltransferase involved in cell wall biosynthesis
MVLTSNPQPPPPLVTVVTSTWQRPSTLRDYACDAVANQTYPEVEHVVVIDGSTDKATVDMLDDLGYSFGPSRRRMVCLGRNWSTYSGDGGFGATCRLVGAWMGAGEFITYLDDDASYEPPHIAEMVAAFDDDTMFVTCPWFGPCAPCPGPPPGMCRTDTSTIMHRAIVLRDHDGFKLDGYAGDGNMIERWLAAGLKWKYKDGATVSHPQGSHHGGAMP